MAVTTPLEIAKFSDIVQFVHLALLSESIMNTEDVRAVLLVSTEWNKFTLEASSTLNIPEASLVLQISENVPLVTYIIALLDSEMNGLDGAKTSEN